MPSATGKMRDRIIFKAPDYTSIDSGGNWDGTLTVIGTRWFKLKTLASREFNQADQYHAEMTHMLQVRNDSLTRVLTPQDSGIWGTRVFEIIATPDFGQVNRNFMFIQVKEIIGRT